MTVSDSANLPDPGGSKTVDTSLSLDDAATLDFAELEDENPEANQGQNDDDTGAEPDDEIQIPDDTDPENPDDGDDGSEETGDEPADSAKLEDTLVTLKGGEQVPVKELKLGYMRDRDYRIKTQDVANKSRSLSELSNRVATTAERLATFLADSLPEEPNAALAMSDPGEYTRRKAFYESALSRVSQIMEMATTPKEVAQQMSTEQRSEMLAGEKRALEEAFPQIKTDEEHEKFFTDAFDTARELGFSEQEMARVTDHRYFKLAHYARLGLQAEAAKRRALQKVNNAPVAVPKGKAQGGNAQQSRNNRAAMQRLSKTGSIKDAMLIDFD